jgi:hypothetical protein
MPTGFVLVNCDLGIETEQEAINKLKKVPGVIDVSEVNGFYDIIVKITSDSKVYHFHNIIEMLSHVE